MVGRGSTAAGRRWHRRRGGVRLAGTTSANCAARGYGAAVLEPRHGQSASESIAEADHLVSHTPLWHHMLRTIIAPVGFQAGLEAAAEGWLRVPMHSSLLPVNGPCDVGSAKP